MRRLFIDVFSAQRGLQILAVAGITALLTNVFLDWDFKQMAFIVIATMVAGAVLVLLFNWVTLLRLMHKFKFNSMDALILALDITANTVYHTMPASENTDRKRAENFLNLASNANFVQSVNDEINRRKAA